MQTPSEWSWVRLSFRVSPNTGETSNVSAATTSDILTVLSASIRCTGSADDLSLFVEVVPHDETVEIAAGGEKDTPFGLLAQAMGKANVFF